MRARYRPRALAQRGWQTLQRLLQVSEQLPHDLSRLLRSARRGRIQVGIERGEVGRVLSELSLELGDLMRLQRVWTKRLSESAELAASLSRAVEETRWTFA